MTSDKTTNIPDGFIEDSGRGPFTRHNGPLYRKETPDQTLVGLRVLERHCNGMGFLHGGMIASFADGALAWAVWREAGRMSVTIRLEIDYLATVRLGDWLTAKADVVGRDGDIVHTRCELVANGSVMAAVATGVFRSLRRKAVS